MVRNEAYFSRSEREITATDTRHHQYVYNQLGKYVKKELGRLLDGYEWNISKDDTINTKSDKFILTIGDLGQFHVVSDSYDPQINIGGAVKKGTINGYFGMLPDMYGNVKVT